MDKAVAKALFILLLAIGVFGLMIYKLFSSDMVAQAKPTTTAGYTIKFYEAEGFYRAWRLETSDYLCFGNTEGGIVCYER
jgi:hypothetical protein